MKISGIWMYLVVSLLSCPVAVADEFSDSSLALCEKVKACAMAQINQEEMTPEMRQMIQPMMDNMCTEMYGRVQEVPTDHALYKPALACLESIRALDCEAMQNLDEDSTPACREYQQRAQGAY